MGSGQRSRNPAIATAPATSSHPQDATSRRRSLTAPRFAFQAHQGGPSANRLASRDSARVAIECIDSELAPIGAGDSVATDAMNVRGPGLLALSTV